MKKPGIASNASYREKHIQSKASNVLSKTDSITIIRNKGTHLNINPRTFKTVIVPMVSASRQWSRTIAKAGRRKGDPHQSWNVFTSEVLAVD